MLWTTDEEIGSTTSRALIEAEAAKSDAVLVFEPSLPGGALKTSRKGVGQFEMIARGVSAHAGLDPGKGVSAVRELARQIIAIDDLQDPAQRRHRDRWRDSGRHPRQRGARRGARHHRRARQHPRGCRANRARDEVAAAADCRRAARGHRRIRSSAARAQRRRGEVVRASRRRWPRTSASRSKRAAPAAAPTATSPPPSACRRSTAFGAIGDGAHALHEHVEIDALVPRAAVIAGLLVAWRCRGLSRLRSSSRCRSAPHQRHHFLHPLVVILGHVFPRVELLDTSRPSAGNSRCQHRHEVIARAAFEVHHHGADRRRARVGDGLDRSARSSPAALKTRARSAPSARRSRCRHRPARAPPAAAASDAPRRVRASPTRPHPPSAR